MSNIIIPIITGIVCLAVGVIGFLYRKSVAEKEIGSAETEATRIINEAIKAGETKKRESILEAKDEIHKLRTDADRDIRERRSEVQRQEKRLNQREEYLDKKADTLEKKSENLSQKLKNVDDKLLEIDGIKKSQFDMLERISGLSQEDAKNQLLSSLEAELDVEKSKRILEYEQMIKDQSDVLALSLIHI